ncbi:hypothetical protein PR003_g24368 [Phytophthora rubi]|uniref:Uncharacterized protein n=1 Tax=Phytophthora rubi TaxID=129364 RepID=A0A6A3L342_9STRA|nr:hypothetical protein PR002_g16143 [Phytophthora rubi]KAE9012358.1 hypothetical protein PR001_g15678 [Phytophthora rubi]KAE9293992.1 hypothetical protein PR003_g24368 [Phytophthora rubi]
MLPQGAVVANYLLDTTQSDGVQWLLDNKYMKMYQNKSASTFSTLARERKLDMMQQVARLHDKKRLTKDWIDKWDWAMEIAVRRGDLPMVKWMAEHRTGREVLKRVKDGNVFVMRDIPRGAAKGGHIGVLEYLFEQGWEDEYASTLVTAAAGGHLECVKWLLEHAPPYGHDHSAESAVVKASENGHLGILQFFHEFETLPAESDEVRSKRRRLDQSVEWWSLSNEAMDKAAAKGHLEVLKWIRTKRYDGCSKHAVDDAARNRHLNVLKWLQLNTTAGCTTRAMDTAAYKGHLEVCKWLHAN